MNLRIEIVSIALFNLGFGNILTYIGSVLFVLVQVHRLKREVVDINYKGSWWKYFKSFFRRDNKCN